MHLSKSQRKQKLYNILHFVRTYLPDTIEVTWEIDSTGDILFHWGSRTQRIKVVMDDEVFVTFSPEELGHEIAAQINLKIRTNYGAEPLSP